MHHSEFEDSLPGYLGTIIVGMQHICHDVIGLSHVKLRGLIIKTAV